MQFHDYILSNTILNNKIVAKLMLIIQHNKLFFALY